MRNEVTRLRERLIGLAPEEEEEEEEVEDLGRSASLGLTPILGRRGSVSQAQIIDARAGESAFLSAILLAREFTYILCVGSFC